MLPGAMQFTRTSYCANSIAADLVNWMTAAFEARYVATPPPARMPPMEEMLMIEPPPCSAMCRGRHRGYPP